MMVKVVVDMLVVNNIVDGYICLVVICGGGLFGFDLFCCVDL